MKIKQTYYYNILPLGFYVKRGHFDQEFVKMGPLNFFFKIGSSRRGGGRH